MSADLRTQHQSPMSLVALSALAPVDVGPDSIVEHIASSNGEDSGLCHTAPALVQTRRSDHHGHSDMPFPTTGATPVGELVSTCSS